jgi:ActR/RegA family two-component response regulator
MKEESMTAKAANAVLIDDDPLIHMVWKTSAKRHGKHLDTFSSVNEFLSKSNLYDPATPIYIDSNLGNGLKGENEAKSIHAKGFNEIYLATGREPASFSKMQWIRGIVGKDAVWDL